MEELAAIPIKAFEGLRFFYYSSRIFIGKQVDLVKLLFFFFLMYLDEL